MVVNNLELLRRENGLTQEELANKLDVSRQTLNYIERSSSVNLDLAFKIARLFNKNIEEVFELKEEKIMTDYEILVDKISNKFGGKTIIIKDNLIYRVGTHKLEIGPKCLLDHELPKYGSMTKLLLVNNNVYKLMPERDYVSRTDKVLHKLKEIDCDFDFSLIDFSPEKAWNYKNAETWLKFMNNVK